MCQSVIGDESLVIGEAMPLPGGGSIVICYPSEMESEPMDLLIHFHGAVSVVSDNYLKSKIGGVLVVINFKGLSSAYAKPFQAAPGLFDEMLDKVSRLGGRQSKFTLGRITLSSFSAGYGAVREILKTPASFDRIDVLVAADSLYASLESDGSARRPLIQHMMDYTRFARLAVEGKKQFLITHTMQETPYASTTETADYLLQAVGLARQPDSSRPGEPESLRLASKATKGKFTVLGYEGTSGSAHLEHLRNIHLWWKRTY